MLSKIIFPMQPLKKIRHAYVIEILGTTNELE